MNANKFFPRLSIRVKLAIAFAAIALVPLAVTTAIGVWVTATQLRSATRQALESDLELAETQTARSLEETQRHVTLLADLVLGPLLSAAEPEWEAAERVVTAFLAPEPGLFRVKLVDAGGWTRFVGEASGSRAVVGGDDPGGMYYVWRAEASGGRTPMLLPVELSSPDGGKPIPAIAVVVPVRGEEGELLGVAVGEARASSLFAEIEVGAEEIDGVTGLVDGEGLFLYHSGRKNDWSTLLATQHEVDLRSEFAPEVSASILSGASGTISTADGRLVSYRPLRLGDEGVAPLTLYRAAPLAILAAPVREFLRWVTGTGAMVVALVLALSGVAAAQLTRPIYRLREAARRLAAGYDEVHVAVATNDEIEDLAEDFSVMAAALSSHRRRLEEMVADRTRALQAAHAELEDILANSADAIIGLDPEGRVRVWNRGAERLFDYTGEEAVGEELRSLIGPSGPGSDRECGYLRQELERAGAVVNFRTRRTSKGGDPFPVSLTQTLIVDAAGRKLGSSLILRDHRMEAKLDDQMRRSERLAAVSVMAAGLAHELNNPLAIIGNRIECMQRDVREKWDDPVMERDFDVLRQHVDRLAAVSTDLLRFAREDGDQPREVDLSALAGRILSLLERSFVRKDLHLEFEGAGRLPPILANEKAIETVLVNLLLNAADATPPGGRVTVRLRRTDADSVQLEVEDSGAGIPPELRARVFEPFFTTKGDRGGTGLGLTVCRTIVEQHLGEIRLENREEGGCRFVVGLPVPAREVMA